MENTEIRGGVSDLLSQSFDQSLIHVFGKRDKHGLSRYSLFWVQHKHESIRIVHLAEPGPIAPTPRSELSDQTNTVCSQSSVSVAIADCKKRVLCGRASLVGGRSL